MTTSFGTRGHAFKSCHPDKNLNNLRIATPGGCERTLGQTAVHLGRDMNLAKMIDGALLACAVLMAPHGSVHAATDVANLIEDFNKKNPPMEFFRLPWIWR